MSVTLVGEQPVSTLEALAALAVQSPLSASIELVRQRAGLGIDSEMLKAATEQAHMAALVDIVDTRSALRRAARYQAGNREPDASFAGPLAHRPSSHFGRVTVSASRPSVPDGSTTTDSIPKVEML